MNFEAAAAASIPNVRNEMPRIHHYRLKHACCAELAMMLIIINELHEWQSPTSQHHKYRVRQYFPYIQYDLLSYAIIQIAKFSFSREILSNFQIEFKVNHKISENVVPTRKRNRCIPVDTIYFNLLSIRSSDWN